MSRPSRSVLLTAVLTAERRRCRRTARRQRKRADRPAAVTAKRASRIRATTGVPHGRAGRTGSRRRLRRRTVREPKGSASAPRSVRCSRPSAQAHATTDFDTNTGWEGGIWFGGNRGGGVGVMGETPVRQEEASDRRVHRSTTLQYLEIPILLRINIGSQQPERRQRLRTRRTRVRHQPQGQA